MSGDAKLTSLFMLQLRVESKMENFNNSLNNMKSQVRQIKKLCSQAWRPSEPQEVSDITRFLLSHHYIIFSQEILRSLTRHYLVKPVGSYTNISKLVKVLRVSEI